MSPLEDDASTAFTSWRDKRKQADRGKSAESSVKDVLKRLQGVWGTQLDWERNPDARSAGGHFTVRTGDFYLYFRPKGAAFGRTCNIEVKETALVKRLPAKNFSSDSVARCYKRHLAGVFTVVLVHHSTVGQWVALPITAFVGEVRPPSWSTEDYPHYGSAGEALEHVLQPLFN